MQYNASDIILYLHHRDICSKICQLLKAFNDATNVLDEAYYPTTYLFVIESVNIVGSLSDFARNE